MRPKNNMTGQNRTTGWLLFLLRITYLRRSAPTQHQQHPKPTNYVQKAGLGLTAQSADRMGQWQSDPKPPPYWQQIAEHAGAPRVLLAEMLLLITPEKTKQIYLALTATSAGRELLAQHQQSRRPWMLNGWSVVSRLRMKLASRPWRSGNRLRRPQKTGRQFSSLTASRTEVIRKRRYTTFTVLCIGTTNPAGSYTTMARLLTKTVRPTGCHCLRNPALRSPHPQQHQQSGSR